jgi:hypothetical protein
MSIMRRLNPVLILLLLMATLGLRLAIPAGYMPVSDEHGIRVQICTGAGTTWVELDPGSSGQDQPRDPCPFGLAMGAALDVPQPPVLAAAPGHVEPSYPGLIPARLVAARTLRPPARGPPSFA